MRTTSPQTPTDYTALNLPPSAPEISGTFAAETDGDSTADIADEDVLSGLEKKERTALWSQFIQSFEQVAKRIVSESDKKSSLNTWVKASGDWAKVAMKEVHPHTEPEKELLAYRKTNKVSVSMGDRSRCDRGEEAVGQETLDAAFWSSGVQVCHDVLVPDLQQAEVRVQQIKFKAIARVWRN